ncbi:MAG: XrtY-associated glycosyltransferase XYAG1 [Sphingobacteriales bacterium]
MKVLQICAAYKPAFVYGGPTMSVSMLSEQLAKAGVSIKVFATTANGKTELPVVPGQTVDVDGVAVTYFRRITKDHTHLSPTLLNTLWKEAPGFDIIHIHAWWNLVSLFSCLIALIRKVPVVISPRGTLSSYSFQNKNIGKKWFIHSLFGRYLLNRSHIHVTSKREYEAVRHLIHPKSISITPNFVKLPGQREYPEPKPSDVFKLLFFSRIEEKKGLDLLLNALPMVSVPFRLTIAGDGDENYIGYLKTIAVNNHIDNKINWVGFYNENKFDLLHDHDLFVLPSYDENFGNVVIESLSVGTAVLISEQVGLAGYVAENNFGWICHTEPASISDAINKIAKENKPELMRIRQNAPGKIYQDFNEDKLVKKYIDLYKTKIKI